MKARRLPSKETRSWRARLGGQKRMSKLSPRKRSEMARLAAAAKRKKRKLLRLDASRIEKELASEETRLKEALDRRGPEE